MIHAIEITAAQMAKSCEILRKRLMPDFGKAASVRALAVVGPPFSGKSTLGTHIGLAAREAGMQVHRFVGKGILAPLSELTAELAKCDADARRQRLIIIDDYHLASDSRMDEAVQSLLAEGALGPSLVLISRTDPIKLLTTSRMRGAIVDIGHNALAFDHDEAAVFLGLDEVEQRSEDFRQIMRMTEGWIAGLCQVRDTLGRGGDLSMSRCALSGATGLMREFLENEVLANVDDGNRDILRKLSLFRIITLDLVKSLSHDRPTARFAQLRQSSLLVPLSADQPDRFAMNPLQKQYLEAEFKDLAPDTWRELLSQAAADYLTHGHGLAAADCLLRANDFEGASKILGDHADQAFASFGEIHEFFSLCQRLPGEYAERFDRTFWIARGAVLAGSFGYAARLIKELESAPDENGRISDRLEVIRIIVALGFGEFVEVSKRSWPFLTTAKGVALDRCMVALALAQAGAAMLDVVGYGQALERARAESARVPANYFQAWVAILSSLRLSTQGRIVDAVAELERALASLELSGAIRHTCNLVLANHKRNLGKYDEAQLLVDRSFRAGARHGVSETVFASLEVACKLKLRNVDIDAALELLTDAEIWVARSFGEHCQRSLKLLRMDILLRSNAIEHRQTIRWLWSEVDAWEGSSTPISKALDESIRLLRARHRMIEGDHSQAISIVQPIIAMAKSSGRMLVWGEASLLRIACLKFDGRSEAAFKSLLSVIETLVPIGCHGLILESVYLLRGLEEELRAYITNSGQVFDPPMKLVLAELAGLMQIFEEELAPDDEVILDVSLTETELKILNFAAKGMRNAEIANRMSISLQTVKWHMHNMFSKMNVRNRTTAIRRAQDLLLIKR